MSEAPTTRMTLLMRLRDRADQEAWARFVNLYGPLVHRLARRHGLPEADAADLMQEVLLAVARGVERYDRARGPFRRWLYVVARNKVRNFHNERWQRSRAHGAAARDALEQLPDESAGLDREWEQEYQQRVFAAAAEAVRNRVSPGHWRVFEMSAVEGRAGAEVAAACGVAVAQVYIIKARLLEKLRDAVAELEEGSP